MLVGGRITSQRTYYDILSVSEDAGIDEIRTRYRATLLSTHPDKVSKRPHDMSEPGKNGHEFFIVQKAWEVLSDAQSKSLYDKELAASRQRVDVVANEIGLEDMSLEINDDGACELVHPCRCGDYFGISSSELEEMGVLLGQNGEVQVNDSDVVPVSVILQCGSCSLKVQLLIEVNLPSIHCKSLPNLIRNCVGTPSELSSEDEDTYYDINTKQMILKELRSRAMRASSKANKPFYSANLTWSFFPPSFRSTDKQLDQSEDASDNEDESVAFFSVKSNFSHDCSSQGATASWDGNKGATKACQSVLDEFKHLEGWPFGLCRRPLVLPPLPNMPADSWMWHRRIKSDVKPAAIAN